MSAIHTTGLGEPEPVGKKSLFRPPPEAENRDNPKPSKTEKNAIRPRRRVRTTIELSSQALVIIQELQNRHRLETGRVLPLWKLVCQAIESYGKAKNLHQG